MANDFASRPEGVYQTLGPGSRIAGYLIGEQIGAGGMAVVFRARDEVLGRLAAVPLVTRLRPELSPAVNGVIARALAKAPADRYRRCADFAAALQEAVDLTRPAPEPDPWAWLARDDRAAWVPAAERPWRPPGDSADLAGSPPAPPRPSPAFRPPQAGRDAGWARLSIPSTPPGQARTASSSRPAVKAGAFTCGMRRPAHISRRSPRRI